MGDIKFWPQHHSDSMRKPDSCLVTNANLGVMDHT